MNVLNNPRKVALIGMAVLIVFMAINEWLYQKHKAEFFEAIFNQGQYRQECMDKALSNRYTSYSKNFSGTDIMALAFTSKEYVDCIKSEPKHPVLDHFL